MEKKKLNLKKIKVAKLSTAQLNNVKGGGGVTNYQCTEKSVIVVFTIPPDSPTGNTQGSCFMYDFGDGEGYVCTTTASS